MENKQELDLDHDACSFCTIHGDYETMIWDENRFDPKCQPV
jgi:hypothetical protein